MGREKSGFEAVLLLVLKSFSNQCITCLRTQTMSKETEMAKPTNLENMSYADLSQMQARIEQLKVEKQNAERDGLRQRILAMVKEHGFEMSDLFGKGRKSGTVAVKYRDPQ